MAVVRERAARRRAQGQAGLDLDAATQAVFAEAGLRPAAAIMPATSGPTTSPASVATLPALRDLSGQWMIREQPFVSHAPLIGPLIVRIRDAWNWMATKWYVRPLIQQITTFHLSVVRAFRDVEAQQQRVADQVSALEALTRRQADELAALRQAVARLQAARDAASHVENEAGRPPAS